MTFRASSKVRGGWAWDSQFSDVCVRAQQVIDHQSTARDTSKSVARCCPRPGPAESLQRLSIRPFLPPRVGTPTCVALPCGRICDHLHCQVFGKDLGLPEAAMY